MTLRSKWTGSAGGVRHLQTMGAVGRNTSNLPLSTKKATTILSGLLQASCYINSSVLHCSQSPLWFNSIDFRIFCWNSILLNLHALETVHDLPLKPPK